MIVMEQFISALVEYTIVQILKCLPLHMNDKHITIINNS